MGFYSIYQDLKEIIVKHTSPSSVNNERAYWLRKAKKFCQEPVWWRAQELEWRFGNLGLDPVDYGEEQGIEKGA